MAKPADFYVGVLDFFSILLPGAVVSWTAWVWLGDEAALGSLLPSGDAGRWVAFVLAAFAAGHIVFMLASLVDLTFDCFRKNILRRTLSRYRRTVEDSVLQAASALRMVSLDAEPLPNQRPSAARAEIWAREVLRKRDVVASTILEPTNTYQWARAVLRLRAPAALAEVLRLEADSKFFRSLFVVFVFLAICSLVHLPGSDKLPLSAGVLLPLAILSYWRYAEQRQKGTIEAYRSVVVLFSIKGVVPATMPGSEGDDED